MSSNQNYCFPIGQHLENCWPASEHCCCTVMFGVGKFCRKLVTAHTKSLFLLFWLFSFKNKNWAPKEMLRSSYRRLNCRTPCRERLINTPNTIRTALQYICISHSCNKYSFVLTIVVYFVYAIYTAEHLMTSLGNMFCFPQI